MLTILVLFVGLATAITTGISTTAHLPTRLPLPAAVDGIGLGPLHGKVLHMAAGQQEVHTFSVPEGCAAGLHLQYYSMSADFHVRVMVKENDDGSLALAFRRETQGSATLHTLRLNAEDGRELGQTLEIFATASTDTAYISRLDCNLADAGAQTAARQLDSNVVTLQESNTFFIGDESVLLKLSATEVGMYTVSVGPVCSPLINSLVLTATILTDPSCVACGNARYENETRFCDDSFPLTITVPVADLSSDAWYFTLTRAAFIDSQPPTRVSLSVARSPLIVPYPYTSLLPRTGSPGGLQFAPLALSQLTPRYTGWRVANSANFHHFVYEPWQNAFAVDVGRNASATGMFAVHVRTLEKVVKVTVGLVPAACAPCYMRDSVLALGFSPRAGDITLTFAITEAIASQPIYIQVTPASDSPVFRISVLKISDELYSPSNDDSRRITIIVSSTIACTCCIAAAAFVLSRRHFNNKGVPPPSIDEQNVPSEVRAAWSLPHVTITAASLQAESSTYEESKDVENPVCDDSATVSERRRMYRRCEEARASATRFAEATLPWPSANCRRQQTENPTDIQGSSTVDPDSNNNSRTRASPGEPLSSVIDPSPHSVCNNEIEQHLPAGEGNS